MERIKVYLDEARIASIVCGRCGKAREISFAQREAPHSSLVKCGCGYSFIVTFEQRQYYRKAVNLRGACYAKPDAIESEPIRITDISIGGLQFEKVSDTTFEPDQQLRVTFRLENQKVSMVVAVRRIYGDRIGTEFISMDEHSKKILGFYLLP